MSERRHRCPGVRLALALLALAGALLTWQYWTYLTADADDRLISFERWKRFTAYSAGYRLPGTPALGELNERLGQAQLPLGAPVFMRIFKREFELELWMQAADGRYRHFATYPICRWSGGLGPKLRQGDRQAPEGFYVVDRGALNPNSRWHRSFNLGFPNAFDRTHGRTGSFLMVHGGCSSIGCYAMTDPVIDEVWKLINAAFDRGQERFQVQVFPFRMSDDNLDARGSSRDIAFWRSLKPGYDLFEADRRPPRVSVCNGRYVFEPPAGTEPVQVVASRCPKSK